MASQARACGVKTSTSSSFTNQTNSSSTNTTNGINGTVVSGGNGHGNGNGDSSTHITNDGPLSPISATAASVPLCSVSFDGIRFTIILCGQHQPTERDDMTSSSANRTPVPPAIHLIYRYNWLASWVWSPIETDITCTRVAGSANRYECDTTEWAVANKMNGYTMTAQLRVDNVVLPRPELAKPLTVKVPSEKERKARALAAAAAVAATNVTAATTSVIDEKKSPPPVTATETKTPSATPSTTATPLAPTSIAPSIASRASVFAAPNPTPVTTITPTRGTIAVSRTTTATATPTPVAVLTPVKSSVATSATPSSPTPSTDFTSVDGSKTVAGKVGASAMAAKLNATLSSSPAKLPSNVVIPPKTTIAAKTATTPSTTTATPTPTPTTPAKVVSPTPVISPTPAPTVITPTTPATTTTSSPVAATPPPSTTATTTTTPTSPPASTSPTDAPVAAPAVKKLPAGAFAMLPTTGTSPLRPTKVGTAAIPTGAAPQVGGIVKNELEARWARMGKKVEAPEPSTSPPAVTSPAPQAAAAAAVRNRVSVHDTVAAVQHSSQPAIAMPVPSAVTAGTGTSSVKGMVVTSANTRRVAAHHKHQRTAPKFQTIKPGVPLDGDAIGVPSPTSSTS